MVPKICDKAKYHYKKCNYIKSSDKIGLQIIPTQDKNRPKADFCPSGFINFDLLFASNEQ